MHLHVEASPSPRGFRGAYSVLKLFTGFMIAALIAWKLTVTKAVSNAAKPAATKIHQLMFMRYAKSCSHLCMKYQAAGAAITNEMATNLIKSFESI